MAPPDPPPATAVPSAARWVEWRSPEAPVTRPVVRVVDVPGGTADRVVANTDVTTFFNDRFHPILVGAADDQPLGTVRFYTADGCAFGPAWVPTGAAALVEAANGVIERPEARGRSAPRFTTSCPAGPVPGAADPPPPG